MGVNDVGIIGVGKDAYNSDLAGMINGRILPWVEDVEADGYPVWTDYGAVQRSTYFLGRGGNLIYQFNITTLDPDDPDDYQYLINLILDYRAYNGPSIIRVTEDSLSIQSAIESASDGDIILVDPGTYLGQINFLDKNVTLASLIYSGYDQNDLAKTILDGDGQGPIVTFNDGQDQSAILLGFIIENGSASQSGGGILIEDASPTIDRNIIHNNHAGSCGGTGGGIAVQGESYPHIFGNVIHDNIVSGECDCICYYGGGVYVDTTSWPVVGGSVTLGNTFYNNSADYGTELFRDHDEDTTNWTPIYAHHNTFEDCPPDSHDVYPINGWDLENCHTLDIEHDDQPLAESFYLYPNFPNPFNPLTNIRFTLETSNTVLLNIYDLKGRLVNENRLKFNSGTHMIQWDASQFPSGIYLIKLQSGVNTQIQKAILVK
jgi:hypothetical protein